MAKRKVFDPTVEARKALDGIWLKSQLRGRCWGRGNVNPFKGTNITFASDAELVTISRNGKNDELILHQFKLVRKTALGDKVFKVLQKAGLQAVRRSAK